MSSEERFSAITGIAKRAAQRPIFDPRPPDEIIGYTAPGPVDGPFVANPELLTAIATRAFAKAKDAAIRENDRLGVPSYGSTDGKIVVRQSPADQESYQTPPLWGAEWFAEVSGALQLAREVEALRRLYGPSWPPKPLVPNRATIEAMQAAERGEVTTVGRTGADLIAALQASPQRDIELIPEDVTPMPDEPEPYIFTGEDELAALLLAMVIDQCGSFSPEKEPQLQGGQATYLSRDPSPDRWLNSYNNPTNADAMIALYEQGLIDITELDGPRIVAKVTAEGRTLLDQLRREQERNAAASWQHRQYTADELASRRD
jgi:hypothetical protein